MIGQGKGRQSEEFVETEIDSEEEGGEANMVVDKQEEDPDRSWF